MYDGLKESSIFLMFLHFIMYSAIYFTVHRLCMAHWSILENEPNKSL